MDTIKKMNCSEAKFMFVPYREFADLPFTDIFSLSLKSEAVKNETRFYNKENEDLKIEIERKTRKLESLKRVLEEKRKQVKTVKPVSKTNKPDVIVESAKPVSVKMEVEEVQKEEVKGSTTSRIEENTILKSTSIPVLLTKEEENENLPVMMQCVDGNFF